MDASCQLSDCRVRSRRFNTQLSSPGIIKLPTFFDSSATRLWIPAPKLGAPDSPIAVHVEGDGADSDEEEEEIIDDSD